MARGGKRPGAGRPKSGDSATFRKVSVSLSPEALILFDAYAKEHKLSRSAAIEKLCRVGLKAGVRKLCLKAHSTLHKDGYD